MRRREALAGTGGIRVERILRNETGEEDRMIRINQEMDTGENPTIRISPETDIVDQAETILMIGKGVANLIALEAATTD